MLILSVIVYLFVISNHWYYISYFPCLFSWYFQIILKSLTEPIYLQFLHIKRFYQNIYDSHLKTAILICMSLMLIPQYFDSSNPIPMTSMNLCLQAISHPNPQVHWLSYEVGLRVDLFHVCVWVFSKVLF